MTKLYQGPTGLYFPADRPWARGASDYHLFFTLELPKLTLQGSGQKLEDVVLSDLEKWVDEIGVNTKFGDRTPYIDVSAPSCSLLNSTFRKLKLQNQVKTDSQT